MTVWRTAPILLLFSVCLNAAAAADGLIQAVSSQDVALVRSLLEQRVSVAATDPDGSTPLHIASWKDNLVIAGLLIDAGADVEAKTRYNVTPLSLACTNGSAAMIERLLEAGADPNSVSEEGQTALMTASLSGNEDAVKLLLTRGADPAVREPNRGQTALMWAASEGNTAAAELLIEFGADVKAASDSGFTPLLFAVREGHIKTARTLLDHGANANDAAPDGSSALNMAVLNAYYEMAALLLDQGANPNAPDDRGSALHILSWLRKPGSDGGTGLGRRSYGPPLPTGNVSSLELARALLDHGANPNARIQIEDRLPLNRDGAVRNPPLLRIGRHTLSYQGATPFYLAAKNGDAEYMRLLADNGADPNITSALGVTPLMVASGLDYWEGESPGPYTGVSEDERLEAVKLAIELGNDINAQADFGKYGDFEMEGEPEYLLLYPPRNVNELVPWMISDPRWAGCTALHGAVVSNQPKLVQYLVDHGAKLDIKSKAGWTPLMAAGGVFFANARRDFPVAAEILRKAMIEQGLLAADGSSR